MKVEVLYPELANLYGDHFNIKYLAQCDASIKVIHTPFNEVPHFVKNKVKMIYLGPMSEQNQELIIAKLRPYQNQIKKLIDDGVIFLATGNALEVFGDYIIDGERKIKGLGIFKSYAIRDFEHRHNSLFLGTYNDLNLVGYKSQFSTSFNNDQPFIKVTRGLGLNEGDSHEGINQNNFFGTYLLGPILVLNPYFTKHLLGLLGAPTTLAFESAIMAAYETRLKEYTDPNVKFMASH